MSGKNQFPMPFNWQSTNPATGFLPTHQQSGSPASGLLVGPMSGTNTIYSQIIDVSKMDNIGLEVVWTGTPVGTFSVQASNSGINFFDLTFNPALAQPTGAPGGYVVDINQFPFKYILLKYVNTAGSGGLTVYGQNKDLN